ANRESDGRLAIDLFPGQAPQFLQSSFLDLADALLGDVEHLADLAQRMALLAGEPEAKLDDNLLPGLELLHQGNKVFVELARTLIGTKVGIQGDRRPGGRVDLPDGA